jgi:hypothetical protein
MKPLKAEAPDHQSCTQKPWDSNPWYAMLFEKS